MTGNQPTQSKRLFTPAQANATLPLVQAIVRDIADLARDLRERHERVSHLLHSERGGLGDAYREELQQVQDDLERKQGQMADYIQELSGLGVELKDPHTGLVDFPAWMNGQEVYLCWRLGEPAVAFWHEIEAGFAGRKQLIVDAQAN
jgi:hypothetical protein